MATLWRKTMYHLGLAPEDEYDDYDDAGYDDAGYDDPSLNAPMTTRRPAAKQVPVTRPAVQPEPTAIGAVRPIRTNQPLPTSMSPDPAPQRPQVVRPVPVSANAKPHALTPVSFNDAQELADKFKGNQPVIMNLQNADRDLARRLIDFASGLCYGVGGQMEKVANSVYLLSPSNVEVSAEERRRMQEHGFSER